MRFEALARRGRSLLSVLVLILLASACDSLAPDPPVASRIELSTSSETLVYGDEIQVRATVYDQQEREMPEAQVSWRSSDASRVQVSAGRVSAAGVGEATITATAGEASATAQIEVWPQRHALSAARPSSVPYRVMELALPAGVSLAAEEVLEGTIDAQEIAFAVLAESTLIFMVPELSPGKYDGEVALDANRIGEFEIGIEAVTEVSNPDAVIEARLAGAQSSLQHLRQRVASDSGSGSFPLTEANLVALEAHVSAARDAFAEATPGERRAIAHFLAANEQALSLDPTAFSASGAGLALAMLSGADLPYECTTQGIRAYTKGMLRKNVLMWAGIGVAVAAYPAGLVLGPLTGGSSAAIGTTIELVGLGIVIGSLLEYVDDVVVGTANCAFVAIDLLGAELSSSSLSSTDGPSAQSAAGAGLSLISAQPVALDVPVRLRGIAQEDAQSESSLLRDFAGAIEELAAIWRKVKGLVAGKLDGEPYQLPSTDAAPQEERLAEARYLSLGGVSNDQVSCSAENDSGAFLLTCSTEASEAQAFDLEIVYASEAATVKKSVPATVWPGSAALTIASGDRQSAYPGDPLNEPVQVRVITIADGTGVEGAEVRWAVASGGGSVEVETGVTDAQGFARTSWTLGSEEGEQTLEARAFVREAEVSASPVVFTATAVRGAMLQLVSGDGQVGQKDAVLPEPLVVRVADRLARPVAGVTVQWAVVKGDGKISESSTVTGTDGTTQVNWELRSEPLNEVHASVFGADGEHVQGSPVRFRASFEMNLVERIQWITDVIDGNGDFTVTMHAMGKDGSGYQELGVVANVKSPSFFDWSPDGDRAVYTAAVSGEEWYEEIRVATVATAGGGVSTIAKGGLAIKWSEDGSTIAFKNRSTNELWLMSPDGSSSRLNSSGFNEENSGYYEYPVAIGSSGRLAFYVMKGGCCDGPTVLWVEGVGAISWSDQRTQPVWSPDGSLLAVPILSNHKLQGVKVIHPSGDVQFVQGGDDYATGELAWSPDGTRIALGPNLYHLSTGKVEWLTTSEQGQYPSYRRAIGWAADGESILFAGSKEFFWVGTDGKIISRMPIPGPARSATWNPIFVR